MENPLENHNNKTKYREPLSTVGIKSFNYARTCAYGKCKFRIIMRGCELNFVEVIFCLTILMPSFIVRLMEDFDVLKTGAWINFNWQFSTPTNLVYEVVNEK